MEDSGEQEQLSHSRQDPEQEQNGDPKARTGDRLWEACHVEVSAEEPGQGRGQDGKVNRSRVPPRTNLQGEEFSCMSQNSIWAMVQLG